MAKLSSKRRNALPRSAFGMPGERKYPMPDKAHARNAKARASQQFHRGNLPASTEQAINRKADAMLAGHHNLKNSREAHAEKMRHG